MELKKNIKVKVYEVIADYKVKIENAPFIAILKFAEENKGIAYPSGLYENLLYPLSEAACKNLLDRLANMGYFTILKEVGYENEYRLTDIGYHSAQNEEFYDQRNGLLKLYVAEENEFIPQRIVKIQEVSMGKDADREADSQNLNEELKSLRNSGNTIRLNNKSIILTDFEEKCKVLKLQNEKLTFIAKEDVSTIKVLDFEAIYDFNKATLTNKLLENEYDYAYDTSKGVLYVKFNPNNLSLFRNISIKKPIINRTAFESVEVKNVRVSPEDIENAIEWHTALLKEKINKYFLSDNDFFEYANKIANEFELFKDELHNTINRKEFAKKLSSEGNFYKAAKLETIDFLNY